MTSVLSNYAGNAALALLLDGVTWVALHESDPTVTGLLATEVAGGGYGRKQIRFAAASGKTRVSSTSQRFAGMPACVVAYIVGWDDPSAGHMIWTKELADPITVLVSGQLLIPKGDIAVSL